MKRKTAAIITRNPEKDGAEALREFLERHGVGITFLNQPAAFLQEEFLTIIFMSETMLTQAREVKQEQVGKNVILCCDEPDQDFADYGIIVAAKGSKNFPTKVLDNII